MENDKIEPKKGEKAPESGLEKKDLEKQPELDDKGQPIDKEKVDVDKEEDKGKEPVDPYDKKLDELSKDNERKGTALVQKNKKIDELKEELKDKGLSEEQIDEVVTKKVEEKLGDIKTDAEELKNLKDILGDQAITNAIREVAKNPGESKIIKFFYDQKVNKQLPFAEQVQQATALARQEMSDPEFQAEVEKANQSYSEKTGKKLEDLPVSEGAKEFATAVFKTDAGKAEFFKRMAKS